MNKKSLLAIEKIITNIKELKIITNGKDDNYFYNSYEIPILCNLIDEIDKNINKINIKIKIKYNNINWNIIESYKENDNGHKIIKLGKIWNLANGILEKELYKKLNKILEIELPIYYKNYCNNAHKKKAKEINK